MKVYLVTFDDGHFPLIAKADTRRRAARAAVRLAYGKLTDGEEVKVTVWKMSPTLGKDAVTYDAHDDVGCPYVVKNRITPILPPW